MKNANFLDSLLNDKNLQIIDMKKGLTNHNYLLTINNKKYVLRVPYEDSDHIVNRHHETLALNAIKDSNIDVNTIYYDETSGYKVTEYLENAYTFSECPYSDKIERSAKLMKKFHQLNKKIDVSFAPIEMFENYKNHVKNSKFNFPYLENIINEIKQMKYSEILCHNDWVSGNILFTKNKTYLIDYEYAANNNPLFDVISFLSENNIFDENDRNKFYSIYFEEFTDTTKKNLSIYEAFEDALWCYWAQMMYESRHEQVYLDIAYEKANAYKKVIQTWLNYSHTNTY